MRHPSFPLTWTKYRAVSFPGSCKSFSYGSPTVLHQHLPLNPAKLSWTQALLMRLAHFQSKPCHHPSRRGTVWDICTAECCWQTTWPQRGKKTLVNCGAEQCVRVAAGKIRTVPYIQWGQHRVHEKTSWRQNWHNTQQGILPSWGAHAWIMVIIHSSH